MITFVLYVLIMLYGYKRGKEMVLREKPDITYTEHQEGFEESQELNLKELGFIFAFGIVDSKSWENLYVENGNIELTLNVE